MQLVMSAGSLMTGHASGPSAVWALWQCFHFLLWLSGLRTTVSDKHETITEYLKLSKCLFSRADIHRHLAFLQKDVWNSGTAGLRQIRFKHDFWEAKRGGFMFPICPSFMVRLSDLSIFLEIFPAVGGETGVAVRTSRSRSELRKFWWFQGEGCPRCLCSKKAVFVSFCVWEITFRGVSEFEFVSRPWCLESLATPTENQDLHYRISSTEFRANSGVFATTQTFFGVPFVLCLSLLGIPPEPTWAFRFWF